VRQSAALLVSEIKGREDYSHLVDAGKSGENE
jgi:hypothetical protein